MTENKLTCPLIVKRQRRQKLAPRIPKGHAAQQTSPSRLNSKPPAGWLRRKIKDIPQVADILSSRSRTYDLVARIGGDEFVVWLDGVDFDVAKRRAGDLAVALGELSRHSGEGMPRLGASVGIVEFDTDRDEDTRQLVARADRAMYDIKAINKQSDDVAIGAVPAGTNTVEQDDLAPLSGWKDSRDTVSS